MRRFEPAEEPAGHTHRLPPWLIGSILIIGLGLLAGLVLVAQQSTATDNRLTALEQYVAGKGEQRDAENVRQDQRIRDTVCDVLDQLPAGGRLDAIRIQYSCGPGAPAALPTEPPKEPAP